jgi:hypothetical protein
MAILLFLPATFKPALAINEAELGLACWMETKEYGRGIVN